MRGSIACSRGSIWRARKPLRALPPSKKVTTGAPAAAREEGGFTGSVTFGSAARAALDSGR